jgi:hypothetical protein
MKKKPVYTRDNKKPAGPGSQPDVDTERDWDEQIHSRGSEIGEENNHEDPDDLVHKPKSEKPTTLNAEDHPNDPDDLTHENDDDDDEDMNNYPGT